jgi:hypothetical protein
MELNLLGIVLLAALCLLAVPYVVRPILLLLRTRFHMPEPVTLFDPRTETLPADVRAYFDQTYRSLVSLGFELAGCVSMPTADKKLHGFAASYLHRTTGDSAAAMFLIASGSAGFRLPFVDFVTRFADPFTITTGNTALSTMFPSVSTKHTTRLPEIRDLALLYRVHRVLVEKLRPGRPPVCRLASEFGGDLVALIRAIREEDLHEQAAIGMLVRTAYGYRLSLRGALRLSWQGIWPMNRFLQTRQRRHNDAILAEYYAAAAYGDSSTTGRK